MKPLLITAFVVACLAGGGSPRAQDAPPLPAATPEHAWLGKIVGEWETSFEFTPQPGQTVTIRGTETVRTLGGLWFVAESRMAFGDVPVSGLLTLGYDKARKAYVGTRIESLTTTIWSYEGRVDDAGRVLTLETRGPNLFDPATPARYRDALEFKGPDHRTFTSSVEGENGEWTKVLTIHYTRKK